MSTLLIIVILLLLFGGGGGYYAYGNYGGTGLGGVLGTVLVAPRHAALNSVQESNSKSPPSGLARLRVIVSWGLCPHELSCPLRDARQESW